MGRVSKDYSPLKALKHARRAMDSTVRKVSPTISGIAPQLSVSSSGQPVPCALYLQSLLDGVGSVPDDFTALPKTSAAIKGHIRPDGAVYLGAFELQGDRSSVVLVYGPPMMDPIRAEQIATLERPALIRRHQAAKLGPFGNPQPVGAA